MPRRVLALLAAALALAAVLTGCGGADAPAPGPAGHPAAARGLVLPAGGPGVLLGGWSYVADPHDRGRRAGWEHHPPPRRRPVTLPYVPNARAYRGAAGRRAYAGSVGWYVTTVRVAAAGRYRITFGSAHHHATVWVDGRWAGSHVGAYVPFHVEADLGPGRAHRVVVRVDWRGPLAIRRSGWDRGWFNYGGLDRTATIARVGTATLDSPRVRTRLLTGGDARVALAVRVRNETAAPRRIGVRGTLGRVPVVLHARRVAPGRAVFLRTSVRVAHPALWSPARPRLLELRLAATGAQAALVRRVGLRELTWSGGRLKLNGAPLRLRGASLPPGVRGLGDGLTPAAMDRLVGELRHIGANATRSQAPLDPALLDRLDAAGILVWQEVGPWEPAGAWQADTPQAQARATRRVLATVDAEQAHPSVVAWSLANEAAGQGHPGGQAEWIDATARLLHAVDPGRLVAADVWGRHPPRVPGPLYADLDALGVTDYVGWYEMPGAPPAAQDAFATGRLAALRALFPGKVLVVSELGAASNPHNPPGAIGSFGYQARLLARRIGVYRRDPEVAGVLVFNLRDFPLDPGFDGGSVLRVAAPTLTPGLNEKGLYDDAGRPKPAVAAVRRQFRRW